MNSILIIAHAPLAHALRQCALHVFPDCGAGVAALDVQPNVSPEETLASARDTLGSRTFSCAFVDIRLPDGSGLDLASEIAARKQRPFLVVMTAQDTVEHTIEAMRRGADGH